MEDNIRLFEIIDELKRLGRLADDKSLADMASLKKSTISMMRNGKQRISIDLLRILKMNFPDVSLDYIIVGTGSLFSTEKNDSDEGSSNNMNQIVQILLEQLKSIAEENGVLKREVEERKSGKSALDVVSESSALVG